MRRTARSRARLCAAVGLAASFTVGMGGTAIADVAPAASTSFVVTTTGDAPTVDELQATVPSMDVRSVTPLGDGIAAVSVIARASTSQQTRALESSSLVVAATPDRRFTAASTPSPVPGVAPWYPGEWDLWDSASTKRAGGYGVGAPRAWTRTFGSRNVVVAVLDTGITPHPDLVGIAKVPGYDFVSGTDGVRTGDGDGWDPDPSDPGDACPELESASSWHGTFVTGEIAARRDRSGVVGEAPGITVEPVRVLGACGGTEADTIAAIEWSSGGTVAGVPANQHPASVISMSLGSDSGACSAALQTAVDDAINRGSVVVAAAGNDGSSMADTSPANCAGVVSVVATTRSGSLATYSNRGTSGFQPTIAAPGGSDADPILGDTWTSTGAFTAKGDRPAIGSDEGTSMATPRVTAAIALLLSVHPGLDPAAVLRRLTDTATPFPAGSTCDRTRCGAGIVDAGDLVGAKAVLLRLRAATVSGSAHVGRRLSASSSWRPSPTAVRYRWLRDGKPIARATGRTYLLRPADAGHRVAVQVRVTRSGFLAVTDVSAARHVSR
ncbi:MAG: S8 family serine peptidase [Acidobacteria bacterium]|nr:S8 family serine peptidase [Acidobacteriota bacterium]